MNSDRSIRNALLFGEQVALRPVTPADAAPAYERIQGREAILRWLVWRGPASVEEMARFFADWSRPVDDERSDYVFAIVLRDMSAPDIDTLASERVVGTIGVRFGDKDAGDIGYWIAEEHWGRGIGTEAIRLVTRFCFEHLAVPSLCAWVFVGNHASRRALEKNGYTHMRTMIGKVERDGDVLDEWYFVLLRSEWEDALGAWRPEYERVERVADHG